MADDEYWNPLVPELTVTDLEASLRFYRGAGFSVRFRREAPSFAYLELGRAQSESNVLLLELKKYEGMHKFMDREREMILQAQQDAEGFDPAISTQNVD